MSPQSQAEEKVTKTVEHPLEGSFGQAKVRSKFPKAQGSSNGKKTLKTGKKDHENLKSEITPENQ